MKKIVVAFILALFPIGSQAFTLLYEYGISMPYSEVYIDVASNDCSATGLSNEEVLDYAVTAADKYWNKVSSANIRIKRGEVLSGVDLSSSSVENALSSASEQTILIFCATNSVLNSVLAAATINTNGGVNSAIGLNVTGNFASLTDDQKVATLAHEIGHALGLGHAKTKNVDALMYYSVSGKYQDALSQDDWDGLTYLYPYDEVESVSCGSITPFDSGDGPGGMLTLLLSILLGYGLVKLRHVRKCLD